MFGKKVQIKWCCKTMRWLRLISVGTLQTSFNFHNPKIYVQRGNRGKTFLYKTLGLTISGGVLPLVLTWTKKGKVTNKTITKKTTIITHLCSTKSPRSQVFNCSSMWRAQVLMTFVSVFPVKKKRRIKKMKKFHISHKFEEKDGGKENYLTKHFLPIPPSTLKTVLSRLVGGLLK